MRIDGVPWLAFDDQGRKELASNKAKLDASLERVANLEQQIKLQNALIESLQKQRAADTEIKQLQAEQIKLTKDTIDLLRTNVILPLQGLARTAPTKADIWFDRWYWKIGFSLVPSAVDWARGR